MNFKLKITLGHYLRSWEIQELLEKDAKRPLLKNDEEKDMGLMDSKPMKAWERWSQKLYDKFGSKLQGKYDKIAGWKLPPEVVKIFAKLEKLLDPELVAKLVKLVIKCGEVEEKYSGLSKEDAVKQVLKDIKSVL